MSYQAPTFWAFVKIFDEFAFTFHDAHHIRNILVSVYWQRTNMNMKFWLFLGQYVSREKLFKSLAITERFGIRLNIAIASFHRNNLNSYSCLTLN